MTDRAILHLDMDAFFVSVELLDHPELVGSPVVVGGRGPRGVVAAASYEARRYGVFSAMSSAKARRLCPDAVFLPGRHARYTEVSAQLMSVLRDVTPLVEPLSLDEAFLDVTGVRRLHGTPVSIATSLREAVRAELGLGCSVGVAANKFVAKVASGRAKPVASVAGVEEGAGVCVVPAGTERAFLAPLEIRVVWGVGPRTHERLVRLGVTTVGQLAELPVASVRSAVGDAAGTQLWNLANGIDDRPVEPSVAPRSVSHEETFAHDLHDPDRIHGELVRLCDAVADRLRKAGLAGRTVSVKIRFTDFSTTTRSVTLDVPIDGASALTAEARRLVRRIDPTEGVRLLGVAVSNLDTDPARQLSLSGLEATPPGRDRANPAVDEIRARYGTDAIGPARLVGPTGRRAKRRGEQQWGPDEEGN